MFAQRELTPIRSPEQSKPGRKLNTDIEALRKEIQKLKSENKTDAQIGAEIGRHPSTVSKHLKKLKGGAIGRAWTLRDIDILREGGRNRLTAVQIEALIPHRSHRAIAIKAKREHITLPTAPRNPRRPRSRAKKAAKANGPAEALKITEFVAARAKISLSAAARHDAAVLWLRQRGFIVYQDGEHHKVDNRNIPTAEILDFTNQRRARASLPPL